MRDFYLDVTYRSGRPLAAYLYLSRRPGEKSYRVDRSEAGLLIDFGRSGKPIGIEITDPAKASVARVNRVLRSLGQRELKPADLAPLRAA
jgi:uncharacterized protein YuzE